MRDREAVVRGRGSDAFILVGVLGVVFAPTALVWLLNMVRM